MQRAPPRNPFTEKTSPSAWTKQRSLDEIEQQQVLPSRQKTELGNQRPTTQTLRPIVWPPPNMRHNDDEMIRTTTDINKIDDVGEIDVTSREIEDLNQILNQNQDGRTQQLRKTTVMPSTVSTTTMMPMTTTVAGSRRTTRPMVNQMVTNGQNLQRNQMNFVQPQRGQGQQFQQNRGQQIIGNQNGQQQRLIQKQRLIPGPQRRGQFIQPSQQQNFRRGQPQQVNQLLPSQQRQRFLQNQNRQLPQSQFTTRQPIQTTQLGQQQFTRRPLQQVQQYQRQNVVGRNQIVPTRVGQRLQGGQRQQFNQIQGQQVQQGFQPISQRVNVQQQRFTTAVPTTSGRPQTFTPRQQLLQRQQTTLGPQLTTRGFQRGQQQRIDGQQRPFGRRGQFVTSTQIPLTQSTLRGRQFETIPTTTGRPLLQQGRFTQPARLQQGQFTGQRFQQGQFITQRGQQGPFTTQRVQQGLFTTQRVQQSRFAQPNQLQQVNPQQNLALRSMPHQMQQRFRARNNFHAVQPSANFNFNTPMYSTTPRRQFTTVAPHLQATTPFLMRRTLLRTTMPTKGFPTATLSPFTTTIVPTTISTTTVNVENLYLSTTPMPQVGLTKQSDQMLPRRVQKQQIRTLPATVTTTMSTIKIPLTNRGNTMARIHPVQQNFQQQNGRFGVQQQFPQSRVGQVQQQFTQRPIPQRVQTQRGWQTIQPVNSQFTQGQFNQRVRQSQQGQLGQQNVQQVLPNQQRQVQQGMLGQQRQTTQFVPSQQRFTNTQPNQNVQLLPQRQIQQRQRFQQFRTTTMAPTTVKKQLQQAASEQEHFLLTRSTEIPRKFQRKPDINRTPTSDVVELRPFLVASNGSTEASITKPKHPKIPKKGSEVDENVREMDSSTVRSNTIRFMRKPEVTKMGRVVDLPEFQANPAKFNKKKGNQAVTVNSEDEKGGFITEALIDIDLDDDVPKKTKNNKNPAVSAHIDTIDIDEELEETTTAAPKKKHKKKKAKKIAKDSEVTATIPALTTSETSAAKTGFTSVFTLDLDESTTTPKENSKKSKGKKQKPIISVVDEEDKIDLDGEELREEGFEDFDEEEEKPKKKSKNSGKVKKEKIHLEERDALEEFKGKKLENYLKLSSLGSQKNFYL